MKEIIAYYTYGGKTKELAAHLANQREADSCEVFFEKKPSLIRSFMLCPAAISQKKARVKAFEPNFENYDKITVMGPIWAGHPAPPVNNIIEKLPAGKQVELIMVSGGGTSKKDKIVALVERQGCTVETYQDVATGEAPK